MRTFRKHVVCALGLGLALALALVAWGSTAGAAELRADRQAVLDRLAEAGADPAIVPAVRTAIARNHPAVQFIALARDGSAYGWYSCNVGVQHHVCARHAVRWCERYTDDRCALFAHEQSSHGRWIVVWEHDHADARQ